MNTKSGCVYLIRNIVNGRSYVGSAHNPKKRWKTHLKKLRDRCHHSRPLQASWIAHGEDAFEFVIVELDIDFIFLLAREQFWIWHLKSHFSSGGYNVSPTAGSLAGHLFSKEYRSKLSRSKKGCTFTEAHRSNISKALKGRVIDEDWRNSLSLAHLGQKPWNKGLPALPHVISAMVAARIAKPSPKRGSVLSDEIKAKISLSKKGKKWTEARRMACKGMKHVSSS